MTEEVFDINVQEDPDENFRARLDKVEKETREVLRRSDRRVIRAELKVEAMRAGMIDMDGLTFLDVTQLQLQDDGSLAGGADLINQLKRAKPWLFSAASSSSVAKVPQSKPTRQKLATEMTGDEYKIARANIIKRASY